MRKISGTIIRQVRKHGMIEEKNSIRLAPRKEFVTFHVALGEKYFGPRDECHKFNMNDNGTDFV